MPPEGEKTICSSVGALKNNKQGTNKQTKKKIKELGKIDPQQYWLGKNRTENPATTKWGERDKKKKKGTSDFHFFFFFFYKSAEIQLVVIRRPRGGFCLFTFCQTKHGGGLEEEVAETPVFPCPRSNVESEFDGCTGPTRIYKHDLWQPRLVNSTA